MLFAYFISGTALTCPLDDEIYDVRESNNFARTYAPYFTRQVDYRSQLCIVDNIFGPTLSESACGLPLAAGARGPRRHRHRIPLHPRPRPRHRLLLRQATGEID